jgi:hypothetical protein
MWKNTSVMDDSSWRGSLASIACPPLQVQELAEGDGLWQLLWELYVRCEVFLKQSGSAAKLIETADVSLTIT